MQIHFYTHNPGRLILGPRDSWAKVMTDIEMGKGEIHTTQMGLLSTTLLVKGYRIFVHDDPMSPEESYEIKLGGDNKRTNREIKVSHNLFKMWTCGEFDR